MSEEKNSKGNSKALKATVAIRGQGKGVEVMAGGALVWVLEGGGGLW